MGRLATLVLPLTIALAACAGAADQRAEIVGPVWVAETITGQPVIADSEVTLTLQPDGKSGGKGGCNTYGAGYTKDGIKLKFEHPFSTQMFCGPDALMAQEQAFFDMLARTVTFETPAGKLILQAPNGQTIVFHQKK